MAALEIRSALNLSDAQLELAHRRRALARADADPATDRDVLIVLELEVDLAARRLDVVLANQ